MPSGGSAARREQGRDVLVGGGTGVFPADGQHFCERCFAGMTTDVFHPGS